MFNFLSRLFKRTPAETVCRHMWELVAKTYAPPLQGIHQQALTANGSVDSRMTFGVTTYIWNCGSCGSIAKEEVLGTDENHWLDIVDKVDKHGMQYIKENGKVYGVAEWVPPVAISQQQSVDLSLYPELNKLPRR